MKTILAALAAVAAVTAVAAPAAAQPYRDHDRHDQGRYEQGRHEQGRHEQGRYNLNQRQDRLNERIEIGVRRGMITRREAAQLRDQSRAIARIEARYRFNGLNWRERADLDRRFDRLDARIAHEMRDRDYGQGYGRR